MNVALTPELEVFVAQAIKDGRYQSASEAIQAALRMLQQDDLERREALMELKAAIGTAEAENEAGKSLRFDSVAASVEHLERR